MDERYMQIAISLAKRGIGKVNPNPLVGAVIVKNDEIIGLGYHEMYGQNHAERNAVLNSVEEVEGSTIYVTLEPCAHFGKQPPCVDLLIEKKFKRVVIGMLDPNPLVAGKSIKKLKDNGIEVKVGVKEEECKRMNEVFLKYITTKLPFVILKSGISLDGKIATVDNQSQWITNEESRKDGHKLRNMCKGIMVGVNTVIQDNPSLTCRISEEDLEKELISIKDEINNLDLKYSKKLELEMKKVSIENPIRIIVDSTLRVPVDSNVIKNNNKTTIIGTTTNCDKNKKRVLQDMGIKIIETKSKDNKVDLEDLMIKLGQEGIDLILIEGGGSVNFSALEQGVVDKVRFYIAPKIIGGENSKSSVGGRGFSKLKDAINLKEISYKTIKNDLVVEGYVDK